MQDEEGPLGSVGWEEAGWIQTLVLLTQLAGCSLGLDEGASRSSSPAHFTSPDPNPAGQAPSHSASAAPLWLCPTQPGGTGKGLIAWQRLGTCWGSVLSPLPQDKGPQRQRGVGTGLSPCVLRHEGRVGDSAAFSPARCRSATTASCTRSGEGPTRKSD